MLAGIVSYFYLNKVQIDIDLMMLGNKNEITNSAKVDFLLNKLIEPIELFSLQNLSVKKPITINQQQTQTNITLINQALNDWERAIKHELTFEKHTIPLIEQPEYQEFKQIKVKIAELLNHFKKLEHTSVDELTKANLLKNVIVNKIVIQNKMMELHEASKDEFEKEADEIKESLHLSGLISFGFMFTILFIALLLALFISNMIIRYLNQFKQAINSLSKGQYNAPVQISAKNEFGLLASAFNKMMEDLASSQNYIDGLINTMPNMLIVTDINLNIRQVNKVTCQELGYEDWELLNQPLAMLIKDDRILENTKQLMTITLPLSKLQGIKTQLQTKKQKNLPVLFTSSYMEIENGKTKLVINMAQDISNLQKIERELVVASRQAGMSDIATSVLHNVGNILNSINTSVSMMQEQTKESEMDNLTRLDELIQQHQSELNYFLTENAQGQLIPKYLHQLAKQWDAQKSSLLNEIELIKKHLDHIINIIRTQQSLNVTGVREQVLITELFDEALSLDKEVYERALINIVKDFEPIKSVIIDRVKLMQIIVNLIKNSVDSLMESHLEPKQLELRIWEKNEKHFVIEVIDNGVGIPNESLVKIFSFGFTTKKKGHGFGLHSCALAAKELGGVLTARSGGPGKGATFRLELPYSL